MSTVTWPTTVPFTPLQGAGAAIEDNYWKFEPDSGSELRQRKATDEAEVLQFRLCMTGSELGNLRTWIDDVMKAGVNSFTAPSIYDSAQTVTYQTTEKITWRNEGPDYWIISISARVIL